MLLLSAGIMTVPGNLAFPEDPPEDTREFKAILECVVARARPMSACARRRNHEREAG